LKTPLADDQHGQWVSECNCLLNEFLKEHKTVQQQQRSSNVTAQVEALSAGLQQVKAQVEATRLTPQVLASSQ